ncbi:lytic transglycosylase domain-containing protein [Pseudoduganella namucuonensis]|uniref:Transglycosylase SLT domain-containing protein n=1 Tax=Pseudoduganella namucuonensis TaxID=1035707 RepID=A0A1I7M7Y3_9BURK|nr:lytic transglycosylase domain-containing protein [Pseudoduganella namucuonensis]SFV17880.1 Transglycosylase SLT domain-containing protein [Pseudoduganella namucuonensis]
MVHKQSLILLGAAGAALLLLQRHAATSGDGSVTAGDDESNFIEDGYDTMTSLFNSLPASAAPYQANIEDAADTYGVPVAILAWLLWKESRYNPAIINGAKRSRVGAMGIAQFMPATAREELGSEAAALDPSIAIPGAARYLARLYKATGEWRGALAAYNWGIGNVQRKGLAAAPAETRDYYSTILSKAGMSEEGGFA